MPAFSLFAILGVDGLRLRLRNRCGLGLNRNPPFLDGHYFMLMYFGKNFSVGVTTMPLILLE